MIYKVDINYKIDGLGSYEETTLGSLEENDYFFLGNNNGFKILIKKVYSDKVILEFDKRCKLVLPSENKEIEIKIGDEISPYLPIDPSPRFKIKLMNIREEQRLYYS